MKTLRSIAMAAMASALVASPALAVDSVTFAQFTQQGSGQPVTYTNTGAGNTLTASNAPVFFVINDFGPAGSVPAVMSLSATSSNTVFAGPNSFTQRGYSGTLSFTGAGGVNLLTVNFIDATLAIDLGLGSGSLFNTDPPSPIAFTSDVLTLPPLAAENFSLAFTSINPLFSVGANGFGSGFTAAVAGSFAGAEELDPGGGEVPEPGTWAMMLAGFGLVGLSARRRRGLRPVVSA